MSMPLWLQEQYIRAPLKERVVDLFLFTINDGLNEQETLQSNVPFLFMATRLDFAIDYSKPHQKSRMFAFS